MKFSQRIGAREPPKSGLKEATSALRTTLWNVLHPTTFPQGEYERAQATSYARSIWNHLGWRTDEIPRQAYYMREALAKHWYAVDWPEFFDLVEHIARLIAAENRDVFAALNAVLLSEGCAYRFIGQQLAPLTNPVEVAEVVRGSESAIPSVATHIREAIGLLPPNPEASPRNSIKESISAVEAAVKHLAGDGAGNTLAKALPAFETKYGALHPALRQGLISLYGYTSDEKGVRHALVDEAADITVDDARFMLVTCSAFANYLVALASRKAARANK